MKKIVFTLGSCLVFGAVTAQTMNSSQIYVSDDALLSVNQDFQNNGVLVNQGEIHFRKKLDNNGKLQSEGRVIFDGLERQVVSGTQNVVLSKVTLENNVDLHTSLIIEEELNYRDGILQSSEQNKLILAENARHFGASDYSHSKGMVTKLGAASFEFPLGDGTNYKGFKVNGTRGSNLSAEYKSKDDFNAPKEDVALGVDFVNEEEYWVLKSSNESDIAQVQLQGTNEKDVAYLKRGTWTMTENGSLDEKSGLKNGVRFTSGAGKFIKKDIGIWPNPTQGDFNLKLEGMNDSHVITVDVTNQDGRVVMRMQGIVRELRKVYSLPANLVTTELTVRVINADEVFTEKLILKR